MVGDPLYSLGFRKVSKYVHLFFDLDHTLWDFRGNSRATLRELFLDHALAKEGVADVEEFIDAYEEINHAMWAQYSVGRIPKEVLRVLRFRDTLARFGVKENGLAADLGRSYLERCPRKELLMPGARELLAALHGHFKLHIITNGFDEVQGVKLRSSGIAHFFDLVLTSEKAGAPKPDPRIFDVALNRTGAAAGTSLMIGDNVDADMLGARQAGWDHVHYTAETQPDPLATHRIAHLKELLPLLR